MTSGAWQSFAPDRSCAALGLILAAGAVGFGLASLGRHTALALGAAVGVIVVFQFGLVTVLSLAQVPSSPRPGCCRSGRIAWMDKKVTLEDYNSCDFSAIEGCRAGAARRSPGRWPAG